MLCSRLAAVTMISSKGESSPWAIAGSETQRAADASAGSVNIDLFILFPRRGGFFFTSTDVEQYNIFRIRRVRSTQFVTQSFARPGHGEITVIPKFDKFRAPSSSGHANGMAKYWVLLLLGTCFASPVYAAATGDASINFVTGNLWLLIATAMVFLMHLGFAMRRSGVRSSSAPPILSKGYATFSA